MGLNWRWHGCLGKFQMKYLHLKNDAKTEVKLSGNNPSPAIELQPGTGEKPDSVNVLR